MTLQRIERLLMRVEKELLDTPDKLASHLRDCEDEIERATTEIEALRERRRIWEASRDRVRHRLEHPTLPV